MVKSGFFNSFHRNSHGELKSTFFDPFEVKHRKRTSKSQLQILEKTFESNKKPDSTLRNQLSEQLGMTPRSVQVWFQNRRAKQKKNKNKIKYSPEENYNQMNSQISNQINNQISNQINYERNIQQSPDVNMFKPIQVLENQISFCNDRFPISPLHEHPLKQYKQMEFDKLDYQKMQYHQNNYLENEHDRNLQFPEVDSLDSSWVDMRKLPDQDGNIQENTACFDPQNFFC